MLMYLFRPYSRNGQGSEPVCLQTERKQLLLRNPRDSTLKINTGVYENV